MLKSGNLSKSTTSFEKPTRRTQLLSAGDGNDQPKGQEDTVSSHWSLNTFRPGARFCPGFTKNRADEKSEVGYRDRAFNIRPLCCPIGETNVFDVVAFSPNGLFHVLRMAKEGLTLYHPRDRRTRDDSTVLARLDALSE
jgi:hypothetical protein